MALIKHYKQNEDSEWICSEIQFNGLAHEWISQNIDKGVNFGSIRRQSKRARRHKQRFRLNASSD